ncbi:MAG: hypothetical protein Q8N73_00570 [bacterium]|nr:hypothetical protein [bacterium]
MKIEEDEDEKLMIDPRDFIEIKKLARKNPMPAFFVIKINNCRYGEIKGSVARTERSRVRAHLSKAFGLRALKI